jgi:hypothetical protein
MPFMISQSIIGAVASTMIVDSISLPDEQIVYTQPESNYCYQIPNKTLPRTPNGYVYQTYCKNSLTPPANYVIIERTQR